MPMGVLGDGLEGLEDLVKGASSEGLRNPPLARREREFATLQQSRDAPFCRGPEDSTRS